MLQARKIIAGLRSDGAVVKQRAMEWTEILNYVFCGTSLVGAVTTTAIAKFLSLLQFLAFLLLPSESGKTPLSNQ